MKAKRNNVIIEIIVVFVLLLLSINLIFIEGLGDLDELWQYNFARNILNGKMPYNDFNIIVTPFFSFLAAVFLKCFSDQLILMRVFNCIIFFSILYVTYILFKTLKINKYIALIFTYILYRLFIYDLGVEYNYLVLLIALISFLFEIKQIKSNKILENNMLQNISLGVLVGLIILTKQSIGIIISVVFIFYRLIYVKNKSELMSFLKIALYRMIGVIIPCFIFLIWIIKNGAFNNFISYCILGVSEFNNKVSYINLFGNTNLYIRLFSFMLPISIITIPIYILTSLKRGDIKIEERNIIIALYIYSLIMLIGMYPVANSGHFIIYAYPFIVTILYCLWKVIVTQTEKNNFKYKYSITQFLKFAILSILLFTVLTQTIKTIKFYKASDFSDLQHYAYIPVSNNFTEAIKTIDYYIKSEEEKGNDVLILDSSAIVYMIPINKYNKDFDTFNKGNFGYHGEERIIGEIKDKTNVKYLILNDKYSKNWQTPINIIEFVQRNKEKIGEIRQFDIYE